MKIAMMTIEFSTLARVAKQCERRFNYWKYRLNGNRYKAWTCTFPAGGHQDVVSSFLRGAAFFPDIEVLVNPSAAEITPDTILYVPSGWRALRDAIELRRACKIKTLIAGPTVVDLPYLHDYIIADPAVNVCLVASQWVKDMFDTELAHAGREANVQIWAAGVDNLFWKPERLMPHENFRNALIYVKNSGITQLEMVTEVLSSMKKEVKVISCGSHVPQEYKSALEWCDFVVILGESETQGLAMAQAWSMNRQTLVFDSSVVSKYHENTLYSSVVPSPAPYLTQETGALWESEEALVCLLTRMEERNPRLWVEANLMNSIAFESLLAFFENENK